MREMMEHTPGRIFLAVLVLSIVAMLWVPRYFFKCHLFFGWMTPPFFAGILFLLLWLIAYLIYFFRFWRYRG